jgi:hypothetical protein
VIFWGGRLAAILSALRSGSNRPREKRWPPVRSKLYRAGPVLSASATDRFRKHRGADQRVILRLGCG